MSRAKRFHRVPFSPRLDPSKKQRVVNNIATTGNISVAGTGRRLRMEPLEDRRLLTGATSAVSPLGSLVDS